MVLSPSKILSGGGKIEDTYQEITDIKNVLNNLTGDNFIKKIKCGKVNLYYKSSSVMQATIEVGEEFNDCMIFALTNMENQTPYTGSNLWNIVGKVKSGTLTVEGHGTGFVNGHMLNVNYLLIKYK